MASASQQPIWCIKKERLMREFAKAVSDYHRMNSAQLAAVLNGQDFPFEAQIAEAGERVQEMKYAILAHRQEHGC